MIKHLLARFAIFTVIFASLLLVAGLVGLI